MTDPTLTTLRNAFAAGSRSGADRACPTPDRLWDAARGDLPPGEVGPLVDHLATCAACAEAWSVARELDPAQGTADVVQLDAGAAAAPAAGPRRRSVFRGPWAIVALAAAALLAVTPAVLGLLDEEPAAYRAAEGTAIRSAMPPHAALDRARPVLLWSGPEGAVYAIRVTDRALRPLASASDLHGTAYTLPADALDAIEDGAPLLWTVEATLPDGQTARSATFSTPVGPP